MFYMKHTKICLGCRLILQFALALVVSVLAATGIMILLYSLPVEPIKANIYRSISVYDQEGSYPQWAGGYKMTQLDNVTDGYMLMEAEYPGMDDPVNNAMMNPYIAYEGMNPDRSATEQSHDAPGETSVGTYARYWHGYLLFLKPLLFLFEVADIRIMNMILCLGLSFRLFTETQRRLGRKATLAMFITWLVINPVSVVMSFQFSTTFYVMMAASLLVLRHDEWLSQGTHYAMFFLFIGIITNYIDFLTYPMVGMAIPLILAILMREHRQEKGVFAFALLNGLAWGVGYAGMWIGKWVMATLITGQNIVLNAINEAFLQSTGMGEFFGTRVTPMNSILKNVRVIVKWPFIILGLVVILWVMWYLLRRERVLRMQLNMVDLLLLLIALLPMVWYSVFQGHSIMCYWFTYRNLSITFLAGMILLGRRIGMTTIEEHNS